ncbi:MAG TPA: hypothetical protein VMT00_11260 [Thermoanaerobaculia bacterium]|nr:hypothetical protein [Thermoanaerobaculia bacterium]
MSATIAGAQERTHPDFYARSGAVGGETFRFVWHIDSDRVRSVNRSVGLGPNYNRRRGFLSRWLTLWLKLPAAMRPPVEVPTILDEDLIYIPSPCYVFASNEERTSWRCWFDECRPFEPERLLDGSDGILLFSVEGMPPRASSEIESSLGRFGFAPAAERRGLTFYLRRGSDAG